MQVIPQNAATPAPIPFTLVDATDYKTPEDISVTGVKPTVFIGGTALSGTAADIVKVNAATGQYTWTPTQAQVNVTPGLVLHGYIAPSGCVPREFFAQIGPSTALEEGSTVAEIVAGVFERAFDATKMSGLTFEQIIGLTASVLLGKASGLATTTATYRNLGDTADAVVGTVDTDGNRSAVTRTASAVV